MKPVVLRVVEEYVFEFENAPTMRGKILEIMEDPNARSLRYLFKTSYFYKPTEGASGVYYPTHNFETFEETRGALLTYGRSSSGLDVEMNEHYD